MSAIVEAMSVVPAAAWAAVAATVLTALIALSGVALTNRANNQRLRIQLAHDLEVKDREFRRERLEELYLLVEGWLISLFNYYLPYVSVMRGNLTYNEALDQTIELGKKNPVNFQRLEMIVDLYFPDFKPELERVLATRAKANEIMSTYKKRYEVGDIDGSQFVQPLLVAEKQIETEGNALKARIVDVARQTYNSRFERTRSGGLRPPTRAAQPDR